jgi:hypothetical protein
LSSHMQLEDIAHVHTNEPFSNAVLYASDSAKKGVKNEGKAKTIAGS